MMNYKGLLAATGVASAILSVSPTPAVAQAFAVLLGGNEVTDAGAANAGDPDGSGGAAVVFGEAELCYAITVKDVDPPTMAHIHEGTAGLNGPIQVILTPPAPGLGTGATSSDCVPVDATVLATIRQNPSAYYVNIHNAAFPGGAVRGQLF